MKKYDFVLDKNYLAILCPKRRKNTAEDIHPTDERSQALLVFG
jgi:hypothetical protein